MTERSDEEDHVAPTVHLECIEAHLQRHVGKIVTVLHEVVSDEIHLDLLVIDPGQESNHWVFVSSGMSDKPMPVPRDLENADDYQFAELTISLPKSWLRPDPWNRGEDSPFENEAQWYPLRLLKDLARYPHYNKTWISMCHSIANKGPEVPIGPGTEMTGSFLLPPIRWPESAWRLRTEGGDAINFFAIVPLYSSELEFKIEHGADDLIDRLEEAGVTDLFDPKRKNVCPGTRV